MSVTLDMQRTEITTMSVLKKTGSHYKLRKSYQQLNNNNVQSMATTQYPKVTVKSQATNVSGDLT